VLYEQANVNLRADMLGASRCMPLMTTAAQAAANITLAGAEPPAMPEIRGLCAAVPEVRVHLPPAKSQRTIGSAVLESTRARARFRARRPEGDEAAPEEGARLADSTRIERKL